LSCLELLSSHSVC